LGLGEKIKACNSFVPLTISKETETTLRIKQVVVREHHTIVLSEDGRLYGCGSNRSGQLGLGFLSDSNNNIRSFRLITISHLSSPIKQIAAGNCHTVVLLENGELYGCGSNRLQQLNPGDCKYYSSLERMDAPKLGPGIKIKQVVTGADYTLILYTDGALYGCGYNHICQLGSLGNARFDVFTSFKVITIPDLGAAQIEQVRAGVGHTLVLLDDGRLYGCGGYDASTLGFGKPDTNPNTRNTAPRTPLTLIPLPKTLSPSATCESLNK
jgi:regulator of chromosome condensation